MTGARHIPDKRDDYRVRPWPVDPRHAPFTGPWGAAPTYRPPYQPAPRDEIDEAAQSWVRALKVAIVFAICAVSWACLLVYAAYILAP